MIRELTPYNNNLLSDYSSLASGRSSGVLASALAVLSPSLGGGYDGGDIMISISLILISY